MPVPVAAQRNVEVFAQPGGKRNVPAAPEIGYRLGAIRRIKVLGENKSQHQSQPDCHVGIATKIKIDLESVGDGAEPRLERSDRASIKGNVRNLSTWISEKNLFRKPEREKGNEGAPNPATEVRRCKYQPRS